MNPLICLWTYSKIHVKSFCFSFILRKNDYSWKNDYSFNYIYKCKCHTFLYCLFLFFKKLNTFPYFKGYFSHIISCTLQRWNREIFREYDSFVGYVSYNEWAMKILLLTILCNYFAWRKYYFWRSYVTISYMDYIKKEHIYTFYSLVFKIGFDRSELCKRHFKNYHEKR